MAIQYSPLTPSTRHLHPRVVETLLELCPAEAVNVEGQRKRTVKTCFRLRKRWTQFRAFQPLHYAVNGLFGDRNAQHRLEVVRMLLEVGERGHFFVVGLAWNKSPREMFLKHVDMEFERNLKCNHAQFIHTQTINIYWWNTHKAFRVLNRLQIFCLNRLQRFNNKYTRKSIHAIKYAICQSTTRPEQIFRRSTFGVARPWETQSAQMSRQKWLRCWQVMRASEDERQQRYYVNLPYVNLFRQLCKLFLMFRVFVVIQK